MGSTGQIQTPLTRDDIDALAARVHRIREDWHAGSLITLLTDLAGNYDGPILRKAAIAAAQDKHIRTPKGIEWACADYTQPASSATAVPCAICGKPRDKCTWERPLVRKGEDVDDHVYLTPAEAQAQAASRRSA